MPPFRPLGAACLAAALSLALAAPAGAVTANGRLQIIHLDVGQGDGALIISPLGQVVLIDEGPSGVTPANGVSVVNQLIALGVTHVDYHFASHYHADHIGNIAAIVAAGIPIDYGWDRAGSYSTGQYTSYVNTLGSKRRTMVKNQVVMLDSLSAHPVRIKCVDLAGAGISTTDENSLSMVLKVSYGEFDQVFGGDLPGANSGSYKNIETTVGPEVGPVEVYKVHHHGSATSSLTDWLSATGPKIGVISEGNGNSYGHPTSSALTRLHNAGVHTYWTETGSGVAPNPSWDKVSNNQVIISATWQPGGVDTVRGTGFADTFTNSGSAGDVTPPTVAVTSPDGGENWKAGSTHPLTWTATDNVGVASVDLAYSTNGGASFPNVIATGIANTGSYSWTVLNTPITTARVRVVARDAVGNLGADSSAANFAISTWTITASAGANGSVSPSGAVAVVEGASQGFTIAPTTGYHVADVLVDGGSVGAVTSYAFNNVNANHTISASFAINTFTITASAGANGSISPSGAVAVVEGASQGFTITPTTGYHVADVLVDGGSVGAVTSYTFNNVNANHTISASFAINTYTITASAGANGTVSPSGAVVVSYGASQLFSIRPATGYHVAALTVDGGPVTPDTTCTFTNVTANHAIGAAFSADTFTLAVATVGATTVTKSPDQPSYAYGAIVQLTAAPAAGWAFAGWSGDTSGTTNPITVTITGDKSVTATAVDVQGPTVLLTAPVGGERWDEGSAHTITWSASDNVAVDSVNVDCSFTGPGGPWVPVAHGLANSGLYAWSVPTQPTDSALVRVVAYDHSLNSGSDASDSLFHIANVNQGVGDEGAAVLALALPRPNPGLGATLLSFSLPQEGSARLEILDLSGRRVWDVGGFFPAGPHSWRWNGTATSGGRAEAGLYFVRLVTPWGARTQRLVWLR